MIGVSRSTVVSAAVSAICLPLYAVFPTTVGLNGDLARYGSSGIQLLCGDGRRVWANYQSEPVFVAVWWALAKFWAVVFGPGAAAYCVAPGANIFWLAITAVAVLVVLQIYIVRSLGVGALSFHLVFCLDTALMMMPFNLIRQFVAVIMVLALISLMLRGRIQPVWFVAALVMPALVHWSVWALFLTGMISLMMVEGHRVSTIRLKRPASALLVILVGLGVLAVAAYVLAGAYLLPRIQALLSNPGRFAGFGLEPTVRGLVSPVTLAVVVFTYAISRQLKVGFARTLMISTAVMYFVVAASGLVPAMERLRMLVLPVTYFAFLYLLHRRTIDSRWQVVNVLFVLFAVFNFSWHAMISRPFADRSSFLQLFE